MKKKSYSMPFKQMKALCLLKRLLRCSIPLLLSFFFIANSYSQAPLLTLNMNDANVEDVIHEIDSKTEYTFLYRTDLLRSHSVETVSLKEEPVEVVLDRILLPKGLEYEMIDNTIVIRKAPSQNQAEAEQQQTVSGTVTDPNGNPLPGVNITVKGTDKGAITGVNGEFTIDASGDATLVFSFLGMTTQEVALGGRTTVNVVMEESAIGIDEVLVTALGIEKERKRIGYAAETVEPEAVTENRTVNFLQSLQGKVAGLNISSPATGPGGSTFLQIRGQSAFSGANKPLIVVDGVPISNQRNFGGVGFGNNSDVGDGLLSINPNTIESMSVLKGGTAAALYGSRAKDGVIMITTKNQSKSRGMTVSFNSNYTMDRPIDDTDFQYEYGQGEKGVRPTAPWPTSGVWSFGEKIEPGMTQILFDNEEVPYTAKKDNIKDFYKGGYTFTNTFSVANQSDNGGFNLTLAQLNNDAITPNSGFERYNANLGFTQNVFSKLVVSGNINYSKELHENPAQVNAQNMTSTKTMYTLANTMPLHLLEKYQRDENGDEYVFSRFKNRTNPYLSVNDYFNDYDRDRIFGNITLRYNINDWLYLQGRVGEDYYARFQKLNFPSKMAGMSPAPEGFVNGYITHDQRRFYEINSDFLIGANRMIGEKFELGMTAGGNIMHQYSELNSVRGTNFVVPFLYTIGNAGVQSPSYDYSERRVNSLYGSAELGYDNYLFLNATLRNDWFSTLSPEERSVLYPSVSGSFVFSQAMKDAPEWLDFGKVRVAYAEVGSDTDVSPFSQSLFYSLNSSLFNGKSIGEIDNSVVPNPNLRPMRVKEYEAGFDIRFFKRFNLDFTYYRKLSIDQILAATISNTSGYNSQLINVGESENRGVELLLGVIPVKGETFTWDVNFNGSYNTSEVLKLGLTDEDVSIGGRFRQVVGQPLGQIYDTGYERDEQGRKIFNATSGLPERTSEPIHLGNTIPKWVGGITNTFNYKGMVLSALVDFKLGHDLISFAEFDFIRHGKHKKTLEGREEGYVIGDGVLPDGSVNTIQVDHQTYWERDARVRESTVYNAGFWKLRQISVGYDFARISAIKQLLTVQELKLSAVANNVYTIKRWTDNMDPEQVHDTGGQQNIVLPLTRSLGFNLNLVF